MKKAILLKMGTKTKKNYFRIIFSKFLSHKMVHAKKIIMVAAMTNSTMTNSLYITL